MLRLHRYTRQHQSKFHSDREVHMHTELNTALNDKENPPDVFLSDLFLSVSSTASPVPVLQHWTPLHS